MRIGIDLTWVKPKKSGGVESYIRNLLDGFLQIPDKNTYVLFTAKDNNETFKEYLNEEKKVNFNELKKQYDIKKDSYYTVCSLLKHKNLITLINVLEKIVKEKINIPNKLVISGVGGFQKEELVKLINEKGLQKNVILTKFVSNEERNCLIENSNVFLFPSLFEGFGMPPVEVIMLGSRVITIKCTSLYEVIKNKYVCVNNAIDTDEYTKKIKYIQNKSKKVIGEYLDLFYKVKGK